MASLTVTNWCKAGWATWRKQKTKVQVPVRFLHTIQPVNYCEKAGSNLFSLTCTFLHGVKLNNNIKNNISLTPEIMISWYIAELKPEIAVTGVDLICKESGEKAHSLKEKSKVLIKFERARKSRGYMLSLGTHQKQSSWVLNWWACYKPVKIVPWKMLKRLD